MRLSDVKGERTFEVVADIIEPVYRIAQDEAAVEMLSPKPCPEGEDPKKFMARRLVAGVPALLRSHKVLNNLSQSFGRVPVVLFFPGTYDEQSLILFDELKDDNYYRAFRLVKP